MEEARRTHQKATTVSRRRKPRVDVAGLAKFFAQQPDVVVAYLFGSVAKGTARAQSDVDVAVLLDERLEPSRMAKRYLEILGRIPSTLATHEIDVRSLNEATPVFLAQVVGLGKLIYARSKKEQIEFEVRAMTAYLDTKPLREFFKRALFREIEEGNFGRRRRRHPISPGVAQTVQDATAGTASAQLSGV